MASEMRLIDASALLAHWESCSQKMREDSDGALPIDFRAVMTAVRNAPTVDAVEVVHGRWIEKQERITMAEDDVDIYWVCSVCGTTEIGKTNYCHNCGATMDGGAQDGL